MSLEIVKQLTKELDVLQQQEEATGSTIENESEQELICDNIDLYWYRLTSEEVKEAQRYSAELQDKWPLQLQYKQAVRVLETWPKPHPNDKTTPESREACKNYWINKLAEITAAMEKDKVLN